MIRIILEKNFIPFLTNLSVLMKASFGINMENYIEITICLPLYMGMERKNGLKMGNGSEKTIYMLLRGMMERKSGGKTT